MSRVHMSIASFMVAFSLLVIETAPDEPDSYSLGAFVKTITFVVDQYSETKSIQSSPYYLIIVLSSLIILAHI